MTKKSLAPGGSWPFCHQELRQFDVTESFSQGRLTPDGNSPSAMDTIRLRRGLKQPDGIVCHVESHQMGNHTLGVAGITFLGDNTIYPAAVGP